LNDHVSRLFAPQHSRAPKTWLCGKQA
jgi:hypothetical protein